MTNTNFKPSLPISRGWLNFATGVEIIAILQLYFFSQSTDKYFAWTIANPFTATYLGAGFGAGFILVFLYRKETLWAHPRRGAGIWCVQSYADHCPLSLSLSNHLWDEFLDLYRNHFQRDGIGVVWLDGRTKTK